MVKKVLMSPQKKHSKEESITEPIAKYLNDIARAIKELKGQVPDSLICFRAESKDYGDSKLIPSIFRNRDSNIKELELNYGNLLVDYNLVSPNASKLMKAIKCQHYFAQSRLLDITFNCLVSLFFLVNEDINKRPDNGIVYVFGFPRYFSPNDDQINELFDAIYDDTIPIVDKNFKVLTNCWTNDRIKAQNGGFILFLGDYPYEIPEIYYRKIIVERDNYPSLKESLDVLFNINQFTIFPQDDNIIKQMKPFMKSYKSNFENQILEYLDRIHFELNMFQKKYGPKCALRKIRIEEKYIQALFERLKKENKISPGTLTSCETRCTHVFQYERLLRMNKE